MLPFFHPVADHEPYRSDPYILMWPKGDKGTVCYFCNADINTNKPTAYLHHADRHSVDGVCALCLSRSREWWKAALVDKLKFLKLGLADSLKRFNPDANNEDARDYAHEIMTLLDILKAGSIGITEDNRALYLRRHGLKIEADKGPVAA